jgi:hypothetical protein
MSKLYFSAHNHSEYSNLTLLDSINTAKKLIKRAKQLNQGIFLTIYLYKNRYKEAYNDIELSTNETSETIDQQKAILLEKTRKYFN